MGCTIGLHWFLLQSVAWTAMLTRNLRSYSLIEAVEQTFDGKHPCSLCLAVEKGKSTEKSREFSSPIQKFEFINEASAFDFFPPTQYELLSPARLAYTSLALVPPIPPPRA
jgi:hypothetical protein